MEDLTFLVSSHIPEARHRVAKHLIGYSTIQFMDRGSVIARYDQEEYLLEGSWFWPAYPGPYIVFHRAAECESWSHRHIAFQGPRFSQWLSSGLWPTKPQRAPDTRAWASYFDEMRSLAQKPNRWSRLRAVNLLEGLLLELAEDREAKPRQEPWLQRVLVALDFVGVDYSQVAANEGMALSTLRRRFMAATGTSLHEHCLMNRISRAKAMLHETDVPLKSIADSLGYQNEYYFNRQFKRFVGIPPARYRQTQQVG